MSCELLPKTFEESQSTADENVDEDESSQISVSSVTVVCVSPVEEEDSVTFKPEDKASGESQESVDKIRINLPLLSASRLILL